MELVELVKGGGGTVVALGVMAYMVRYFMGKLDERDKAQKEVIEKNTQVLERVLVHLAGMPEKA